MTGRHLTFIEHLLGQHKREHPDCTYGTVPHYVTPGDGRPGRFLCEPEDAPPDANAVTTVPSQP